MVKPAPADELKRLRRLVDRHIKTLSRTRARDLIEEQIAALEDLLWWEKLPAGPEATRDEVGFARSPQRDCRTERVEPAVFQRDLTAPPGVYCYHPDYAEQLRAYSDHLWNVEAVEKLEQMFDRLGVPEHYR